MDLIHVVVENSGLLLEWNEVKLLPAILNRQFADSQRTLAALFSLCDIILQTLHRPEVSIAANTVFVGLDGTTCT